MTIWPSPLPDTTPTYQEAVRMSLPTHPSSAGPIPQEPIKRDLARNVHNGTYASNDAYSDDHERYVQEIEVRFDLHPPKTPEIASRMDEVRSWYKALALRLSALPSSRERSLALTHLEESLYQAIASIARSKENL